MGDPQHLISPLWYNLWGERGTDQLEELLRFYSFGVDQAQAIDEKKQIREIPEKEEGRGTGEIRHVYKSI